MRLPREGDGERHQQDGARVDMCGQGADCRQSKKNRSSILRCCAGSRPRLKVLCAMGSEKSFSVSCIYFHPTDPFVLDNCANNRTTCSLLGILRVRVSSTRLVTQAEERTRLRGLLL